MRSIRRLATGLALAATVASALLTALAPAARAQDGRLFKNAWFWGAKAGNMTYWTYTTRHGQAPVFGGEWLITRTRGALYVSMDQAFFNGTTSFFDPEDVTDNYYRVVDIKNMRRVTFAAMAFPGTLGNAAAIRPYAGVGFTMNFIQEARPRGTYNSSADLRYVAERLDDEKSRAAPIAMVGLQLQLLRFSVFGQGSYMPAQDRFLLNNNETYFIETGVRWNIGSSIERPQ
jgi:hypothetical protein